MRITVDVPTDISAALDVRWDDVSRSALEAIAAEAYRTGVLDERQVRRWLGFARRSRWFAFLKKHHATIGGPDAGTSGANASADRGAQTAAIPPPNRDFVRVGRSRIAGKGVFAKKHIPKGTRVIEYTGARVPIATLLVPITEGVPTPIYALRLNETTAIDGARDGNDARFVNHSCDPNCEVYVIDNHAYVYAMENLARGDELTFDYKLRAAAGGRRAARAAVDQVCRCGSRHCRGTMRVTKRKR